MLQKHKYYVGCTRKTPKARFAEHVSGNSAAVWCKKYPPISIMKAIKCHNVDQMRFCERTTTFDMMKQYGYEQVRGANFCQLKPINLEHLAYDIAQIAGDDAELLIKTLRKNGPMKGAIGSSKYF